MQALALGWLLAVSGVIGALLSVTLYELLQGRLLLPERPAPLAVLSPPPH